MKKITFTTMVIFGTFLMPLAVMACMLAINTGYTGSGLSFSSMKWSGLFWLALAGLLVYLALIVLVAAFCRDRKTELWLPLASSAIIVSLFFGVLEIAARALVKEGALGLEFGSMTLRPYEWAVAQRHNQELYERSLGEQSFYVGHSRWGWAAGPGRESEDGLYQSSAEGLRSEVVGENLRTQPHTLRLALYGDSFMFSEEVSYPESLQYFLGEKTPESTQILNFGMPGYGIDQAYLSFTDSADEWKPHIAVLGFIQHDLIRAFDVYTFLRPSWNIPFSKPRFEVDGDLLRVNNVPNLSPTDIFSVDDIRDLPFLEMDQNYFGFDWRHSWGHNSMLFRILASVFPRYPIEDAAANDRISELGAQVSSAFQREAKERGIRPLIVYLPSTGDFGARPTTLKDLSISRAEALGVEIVDLTRCLTDRVEEGELFVTNGVHYSAEGNRALAACLIAQLSEDL